MIQTRRQFLRKTVIIGAGAALVSTPLLSRQAFAAWPASAYDMKSVDEVVNELYGSGKLTQSTDINIKAPSIAENGAVVPVSVNTGLKNVESISILVDENPNPLVAKFGMVSNQKGHINTRIKMNKTSNVIAVVKADGKLYTASQKVKVTIGGCGG